MKETTKQKIGDRLTTFISLLPFIVALVIALGYIALRIYCFANYGNTPVTELPAWVWWVMQPAGGKT